MITLFLDTSSVDLVVAIVKDNKIIAKFIKNVPNQHSIYTTSYIDKMLKKANLECTDVDRIMVVNGPGSFTGVRIGVTVAKTYAYILDKDIICVSSLKMRALSFSHDYCLSLIDARNDNYYIGLYDKNNKEIVSPKFANKEEIIEIIRKYNPACVGDKEGLINDVKIEKKQLDIVNIVDYYKSVDSINPHLVVPNYLKLPQAMEKKK